MRPCAWRRRRAGWAGAGGLLPTGAGARGRAPAEDQDEEERILAFVEESVGVPSFDAIVNNKLTVGCRTQSLNFAQANVLFPGIVDMRRSLRFLSGEDIAKLAAHEAGALDGGGGEDGWGPEEGGA